MGRRKKEVIEAPIKKKKKNEEEANVEVKVEESKEIPNEDTTEQEDRDRSVKFIINPQKDFFPFIFHIKHINMVFELFSKVHITHSGNNKRIKITGSIRGNTFEDQESMLVQDFLIEDVSEEFEKKGFQEENIIRLECNKVTGKLCDAINKMKLMEFIEYICKNSSTAEETMEFIYFYTDKDYLKKKNLTKEDFTKISGTKKKK